MKESSAKGGELGQLLRLHERLLTELQKVRDELVAPTTKETIARAQNATGVSTDGIAQITTAVEEALRAVKLSESSLRVEMTSEHPKAEVQGIDNLPAPLARFIAERSANPGFTYEVIRDENRGWIIRWKEFWDGRVRGSGQFYERPYAWLSD